uniref:ARAD1A00286p n=1 Tax=Blastobotrys adeninivorans TaxID=409370 RepID=A0A060SVU5_BLAAD
MGMIEIIALLTVGAQALSVDSVVQECKASLPSCASSSSTSLDDCACNDKNIGKVLDCIQQLNGTVNHAEAIPQICGDRVSVASVSKAESGGHSKEGDSKGSSIAKKAKKIRKQNTYISRKYASAMLSFLALCFVLRIISNLVYKLSSKVLRSFDNRPSRWVRKHILLPATFGTRHSQPHYAGPYTFVMPTRAQSLMLVAYFIINFIIMFPTYPLVETNESGANSKGAQLSRMVANRAGIIAIAQFPFLVLFGGRNNFLIWVTGWPLDHFNVLHKWIGRGVVVNLIIHGIAYSANYAYRGIYASHWSRPVWYWGILGVLAAGFILGQSVHFLRALRYELFLIVHILLAIVFTIAAWHHVPHGNQIEFIYAAVAVWCFDRLLRLLRIVWGGLNTKATVKLFPDDIIQIDINYSKWWKPYPGAYVFLHFLRWNRFWQNHPFTITEPPQNVDGKIRIMARTKAGITNRTKNYLLKKPDHTCEMRVLVEGPYGPKHHLQRYNRIMFIAGGIGIPGVYGYADALRKQGDSKHRITLLWVIRDERPLQWFGEQLNYLASDERFDVRVHISQGMGNLTESSETDSVEMVDGEVEKKESMSPTLSGPQLDPRVKIAYGIPNVYNEVRSVIQEEDGMSAYMVCGPGGMNDMVRKSVRDHIMEAKNRIDYFEEAFSW